MCYKFSYGTDEAASRLLSFCSNQKIDKGIRSLPAWFTWWGMKLDTDLVLGHYRPMPNPSSMSNLTQVIGEDLRSFLVEESDPTLVSLATSLAQKAGLSLNSVILGKQIKDTQLDPQVRVANLRSLFDLGREQDNQLLLDLLTDFSDVVIGT